MKKMKGKNSFSGKYGDLAFPSRNAFGGGAPYSVLVWLGLSAVTLVVLLRPPDQG